MSVPGSTVAPSSGQQLFGRATGAVLSYDSVSSVVASGRQHVIRGVTQEGAADAVVDVVATTGGVEVAVAGATEATHAVVDRHDTGGEGSAGVGLCAVLNVAGATAAAHVVSHVTIVFVVVGAADVFTGSVLIALQADDEAVAVGNHLSRHDCR